jgi:hypothetical protein
MIFRALLLLVMLTSSLVVAEDNIQSVRSDGPSFRNEVMAVLSKAGCNLGLVMGIRMAKAA